ncbi:hypothetical protein CEXT_244931 [Caerostris extrusa]|uniref:Uncharacterized protein n=1 Tax=Caerostris extrusa TaxID=172846 RepID=A0AAV4V4A5_CAEEX|nr:hypothetical protein CEXT_244931 [Caerostris extrusa]
MVKHFPTSYYDTFIVLFFLFTLSSPAIPFLPEEREVPLDTNHCTLGNKKTSFDNASLETGWLDETVVFYVDELSKCILVEF